MSKKHRLVRTDDWVQLELRFAWTEQRRYEPIRPVVLFGESAEERALETGEPIRTIYRNLQRFTTKGMAGLLEPDQAPKPRALPQAVRALILALKAEHSGLSFNEIARICAVRLNYHPSPIPSNGLPEKALRSRQCRGASRAFMRWRMSPPSGVPLLCGASLRAVPQIAGAEAPNPESNPQGDAVHSETAP